MELTTPKPRNILLIAGILFAVLFYPLMGKLVTAAGYTQSYIFYTRLIIWLEVALLFFYARLVEKNQLLLWKEEGYNVKFYIKSFFALYGLAIIAGIISNIPVWLGGSNNRAIMNVMVATLNKNMILLFFSAATAGITEEFIFRAYMVPRLELVFKNKYMPVIISSALFGAIHYRYHSVTEVIFAGLFGAIFAIHYQKYRNIRILMFTHGCVDLVSFLIIGLHESRIHHH
jgi:membrane protease YdiL (CAAX protease family)